MTKQKQAFTLVELIVVITILAILGTIAFISLQGYSRDARDSVRLSDIKNIEKALELEVTKNGKVPKPSNALTLELNGTIIGYQGEMGGKEMGEIGIMGGKDPIDGDYYTYRTNGKLTTYQLMGFLESADLVFDSNIFQINAADLTKRLPIIRGNTLGILLEQNTNNPLQNIEIGVIDLKIYTGAVDMYLTPTTIESVTGTLSLYGTMEALSKNQNFSMPNEPCSEGFIPVPGNKEFGQPAFCVAKYEMSYEGLIQIDNSLDWNTYSYKDNNASNEAHTGILVSAQGNSPIAEITQVEAIAECKGMGKGYHLITNNQWMTIARNIESEGGNWSSGNVGEGYIFNGVSNNLTLGCVGKGANYLPLPSAWATVTGDRNCTNQKNKLILSNGEEIWDLSGNVREHVNKTNDINSLNGIDGTATKLTTTDGWINWVNTGITSVERAKYGPSISTYTNTNGVGKINDSTISNNIFLRGGIATESSLSGVFALRLNWSLWSNSRAAGFRCAK